MGIVTRRLLAAAVMAAVLVSGCSRVSTGAGGAHGSSRGIPGVVRIVGIGSMDNPNPELSAQIAAVDVAMLWGGWFFIVDDKGGLEPDLATEEPTLRNGGISKDGLTIRYHLRRGVQWQDGQPFTARDAIFTWHAIMNPANNILSRTGYDVIASMEAPDPYTLLVHLKHPYSPAVASYFSMSGVAMCVLPEHLLGGMHDINHAAYNSKPVGTGPFIVEQYDPQSGFVLTANPHFWRGAPKLREIRVMLVADENTRAVMMRTGEADLYYDPASRMVPELRTIPGTRVLRTPFNEFWYLSFNLNHPPLDDIRVRRAIAMAIDKQYVVTTILHGAAIPAQSDQPSFSWAHDPTLHAPPYDPAAAGRLLDSAGWSLGPDGYRHKAGKLLELTYSYSTNAGDAVRYGPLFQSTMKQLGIAINVKGYPDAIYYESKPAGGILYNGRFDIAFEGWIAGVDPDDRTLWACDQQPPNGFNSSFLCDPRVDAQENIATTSYDRSTRRAAYFRIQRLLNEDLPAVFLYWDLRNDDIRDGFTGYRPAPDVTEFWNSWEWNT
jgi:peptide/nickel transport system substrate-binding protein